MIFFIYFCKLISLVIFILLTVAYLTLLERKILGNIQKRKGPTIVGFFGLLQPFADALKLLLKETIIPYSSNKYLFIISPILSFVLSIMLFSIVPFSYTYVLNDIDMGILYIFSISLLNVYSLIIAGWSSNSRYAFLGAIRSVAQMISYEVSMSLIILPIILFTNSLNLTKIVIFQINSFWFCIILFGNCIMFCISMLAETNRIPFDLVEAESELVAGYNVEYSAVGFALFFIAEYANIIFMAMFCVILFFGGWSFLGYINIYIFIIKVLIILFFFILIRAAFPRYRYDQLMTLGWKILLPYSFISFLIISFIFYFFFNICYI